MDFPNPRLSRRAVMQSAAIAPVIALASRAWAEPTKENVLKLAFVTKKVPEAQLQAALDDAESKNADRTKFELVARALWAHFCFGVGNKVGVPDSIFADGYAKSSGPLILAVKDDKFDPMGNDYQTNICAYICGHKAATKAFGKPQGSLDTGIFNEAWDDTEAEMKQKIERAQAQLGENVKPPSLGYGC